MRSRSPFRPLWIQLLYSQLCRRYGHSRKLRPRFTRLEQKVYTHLPLKARALNFKLRGQGLPN